MRTTARSLQGSNRRVGISTEVVTPGRPDCMVDLGSQIITSQYSNRMGLGNRRQEEKCPSTASVQKRLDFHQRCTRIRTSLVLVSSRLGFPIRNRNSFMRGLVPTDRVISKSVVTF